MLSPGSWLADSTGDRSGAVLSGASTALRVPSVLRGGPLVPSRAGATCASTLRTLSSAVDAFTAIRPNATAKINRQLLRRPILKTRSRNSEHRFDRSRRLHGGLSTERGQ